MWDHRYLFRMDLRMIFVMLGLMFVSLLVISSHTIVGDGDPYEESFFTSAVISQLRWFAMGIGVFLVVAAFDYNKIREMTWFLYAIMLVALVGLFFTEPIQHVHRWYRIPGLHTQAQPSEVAKLIVVFALSWFLERRRTQARSWGTAFLGGIIVGIPFLLIFKQPDLGTSLVLYPIALVMFYFGDIHPWVIRAMGTCMVIGAAIILLFFLGIVEHEEMRPYATKFLKDYQYERLNPHTSHQKAAVTAIAIGGLTGTGWRQSEFSGRGWLFASHTDSVFPAFGEEFGLIGLLLVLVLFYSLVYFGFQVSAVAKDYFGRMLSAGIAIYLAMHILTNIAMMCGLLPITGVPLILISYGGSSVLVTMAALGILQSIYSRRFMF